jgi:hypothetical protein
MRLQWNPESLYVKLEFLKCLIKVMYSQFARFHIEIQHGNWLTNIKLCFPHEQDSTESILTFCGVFLVC